MYCWFHIAGLFLIIFCLAFLNPDIAYGIMCTNHEFAFGMELSFLVMSPCIFESWYCIWDYVYKSWIRVWYVTFLSCNVTLVPRLYWHQKLFRKHSPFKKIFGRVFGRLMLSFLATLDCGKICTFHGVWGKWIDAHHILSTRLRSCSVWQICFIAYALGTYLFPYFI